MKSGIGARGPSQNPEHLRDWPNEGIHEVLALAQHHGLPTRLLDWTRRAHTAAYFAASGVIGVLSKDVEVAGNLAVWVLDQDRFQENQGSWTSVRVPGSVSANLAAQEGEFTLRLAHHSKPEDQPQLAIDEFFADSENPPLLKIIAPKQFAGKIIRRCQRYGVSRVNLFPDYYGAVRATLEQYSGL